MTILFVVLFLGYQFQYKLSMTMTGMNNYEKINCNLFEDSLEDFQTEQDNLLAAFAEKGDDFTMQDAYLINAHPET